MEEKITVINHTTKKLRAEIAIILHYRAKTVYANDYRVFYKDIEVTEREFRILITEENGEENGE